MAVLFSALASKCTSHKQRVSSSCSGFCCFCGGPAGGAEHFANTVQVEGQFMSSQLHRYTTKEGADHTADPLVDPDVVSQGAV